MKKLLLGMLAIVSISAYVKGIVIGKGTFPEQNESAPAPQNMGGIKMVLQPSMYYSLTVKNDTQSIYFLSLTASRARQLINPGQRKNITVRMADFPVSLLSLDPSLNDFMLDQAQAADLTDYDKSNMSKRSCGADEQELYFRVTKASSAPGNMGSNKIMNVTQLCVPQNPKKAVSIMMTLKADSADLSLT